MNFPDSSSDNNNDSTTKYRPYHPYQDLNIHRNLYQLPITPEYLFAEEAIVQRRSTSENLQYYTGLGYLGGAVLGGIKGGYTGVAAAEKGDSLKIRVNRVLNHSGSVGRRFGNNVGICGLIYAALESGVVWYRDEDDAVNSVLAGLGTGMLWKCAKGVKGMAVAGVVGGVVAGLAVAGKQTLKRYVPI